MADLSVSTSAIANSTIQSTLASWLTFPKRIVARTMNFLHRTEPTMQLPDFKFGPGRIQVRQNVGDRRSSLFSLTSFLLPNFAFSRYALGLIVTNLLVHRVQHLVTPRPRRAHLYFRPHHLRSLLQFWSLFFPIDIESTATRFCLSMPSSFLLLRALTVMATLVAQSVDHLPSSPWAQRLGNWVANKYMDDICWSVFFAVCFALITNQFIAGLEGWHNYASSMNIFTYSVHLHGVAISYKTSHSRPSFPTLIMLTIPLLQLTMLHIMAIRQSWARSRLLPTTLCGLLNLVNFYYAIFRLDGSPFSYPFSYFLGFIMETLLLAMTVITVVLNAVTQLLLEGSLTRPLIGRGSIVESNLFGVHPSAMPSLEDEFTVALYQLGTASFDATGVAGLRNEVSSVVRPTITLDKINAESTGFNTRLKGFDNEIIVVQPTLPIEEAGLLFGHGKIAAAKRYVYTLGRLLLNIALLISKAMKQRYATWRTGDRPAAPVETIKGPEDIYQAFLRGGNISDDDSDPYVPGQDRRSSTPSSGDESDDDENEDTTSEGVVRSADIEPYHLFTDLGDSSLTRPPTPLLVAHLAASGESPLTRRRYNHLRSTPPIESSTASEDWLHIIQARQRETERKKPERALEASYTCVICAVEPRDIICWPCRCLAICNDCRANLASRSSPRKHLCPTCRNRVRGYSRIFIP